MLNITVWPTLTFVRHLPLSDEFRYFRAVRSRWNEVKTVYLLSDKYYVTLGTFHKH
jgi:hypothetical protein